MRRLDQLPGTLPTADPSLQLVPRLPVAVPENFLFQLLGVLPFELARLVSLFQVPALPDGGETSGSSALSSRISER